SAFRTEKTFIENVGEDRFVVYPVDIYCARTVDYVQERREFDVKPILLKVLDAVAESRDMTLEDMESAESLFKTILSTKFHHWDYENEIREFTTLETKDHGMYFLDFQEQLQLVEVILGMNCPVEIADILSSVSAYPEQITISKTMPSPTA